MRKRETEKRKIEWEREREQDKTGDSGERERNGWGAWEETHLGESLLDSSRSSDKTESAVKLA